MKNAAGTHKIKNSLSFVTATLSILFLDDEMIGNEIRNSIITARIEKYNNCVKVNFCERDNNIIIIEVIVEITKK